MNRKNPFLYIGIAFSVYLLLSNTLSMLAVQMVMALNRPVISLDVSIAVSILIQYLISLPIAILIIRQVPPSKIQRFNMRAGDFFSLLIMLYPMALVGNIIGRFVSKIISTAFNIPVYNPVDLILGRANPLFMLVLVGILAPIVEEYMTRKLILDRTAEYGEGVSVVFSATIFALIHGNFYQSFYAFGLGACFAYVYLKTGKLRYSSLMHIIINSGSVLLVVLVNASGLMSFIETENLTDMETIMNSLTTGNYIAIFGILFYLLVYLTFIVLGTIFWFRRRKKMRLTPGLLKDAPLSEKAKILFLNWGMLIFLLISIYTFVDNIMMTLNMP